MRHDFVHGRVYIAGAYRVGLGKVGSKWIKVAYLTDGGRLVVGTMSVSERRHFQALPAYPTHQKLARRFLRLVKASNMTRGARALVEKAKVQPRYG